MQPVIAFDERGVLCSAATLDKDVVRVRGDARSAVALLVRLLVVFLRDEAVPRPLYADPGSDCVAVPAVAEFFREEGGVWVLDDDRCASRLTRLARDERCAHAIEALGLLSDRQRCFLDAMSPRWRLVRDALSHSEVAAFRNVARCANFALYEDSVDGLPSHHCLLMEDGELLVDAPWLPAVAARLAAHVGDSFAPRDAFMRRYEPGTTRASLAAHFDVDADATLVFELEGATSALFVQTGPHASTRRRVRLDRPTDGFLHYNDLLHGVMEPFSRRVSLVFWFEDAKPPRDSPRLTFCDAVLLEREGDVAAAERAYAELAHHDSFAASRLGSLREDRGDLEGAVDAWTLAALEGNHLAQTALADAYRDGGPNVPVDRDEVAFWDTLASQADIPVLVDSPPR